MGIFSKILPIAETAAGIALEFVPGGQVMGAMLITEGIASSGVIGGSVGQFLKSGWGQAAIAAVGLGATAYAALGQSVGQTAAATENAGVQQAANAATGGASNVVAASAAGDTLPVPGAISGEAGVNNWSMVTDSSAATNGATQSAMQTSGAVSPTGSVLSAPQQTAAIEQASTGGSYSNAVAEQNGSLLGEGPEGAGGTPPPGTNATLSTQTTAAGGNTGFTPDPTLPGNSGFPGLGGPQAPPSNVGPTLDASGAPGAVTNTQPATLGSKLGGIFSGNGAGNGFSISPATAAIQAGSNLVGGLGQGIMQKQATQDEINAAQWAQKSFIGAPGKAVASAAGAPTTVPNGYLSRAAALRNMLGQPNNTPPGVSPPTTGLPPTMSAVPPGGGPVPIAGMNATPAGGVI